jgi:hypothetical protein
VVGAQCPFVLNAHGNVVRNQINAQANTLRKAVQCAIQGSAQGMYWAGQSISNVRPVRRAMQCTFQRGTSWRLVCKAGPYARQCTAQNKAICQAGKKKLQSIAQGWALRRVRKGTGDIRAEGTFLWMGVQFAFQDSVEGKALYTAVQCAPKAVSRLGHSGGQGSA